MHDFPVDLPDATPEETGGLRWTSIVIGSATLLLFLTNAGAVSEWGAEQTPSAAMAQFGDVADGWHDFTDRTGLGAVRNGLHQLWKRLEKMRWPGQEPDQGDQR